MAYSKRVSSKEATAMKQKGKTKRSRQLAYRVEPRLVQQLDNLVIDMAVKDRYVTTRSEIINMMLKEGLESRGYSIDAPVKATPKGR